MTATPTATTCAGDGDCDGVLDASDNCASVHNPGQQNSNSEITDLPPSILYDDATNPASSPLGDACNPDVDGDGLTSAEEAGAGTSATNRDSDGDLAIDGAEVTCGSDPLDGASRPSGPNADLDMLPDACEALIGTDPALPDTEGDGVADGVEFLRTGTDPLSGNTDGDGCGDGRELGSINGDQEVNVIDLNQIANRLGTKDSPNYFWTFDVNRDSIINVLDLLNSVRHNGACP
jgi:hypothetical protein